LQSVEEFHSGTVAAATAFWRQPPRSRRAIREELALER
jgi:hypothetical protein